jgi:hypothetical protein
MKLVEIESDLDHLRNTGNTSYSLVNHVDVLIAMLGEARVLRASQDA